MAECRGRRTPRREHRDSRPAPAVSAPLRSALLCYAPLRSAPLRLLEQHTLKPHAGRLLPSLRLGVLEPRALLGEGEGEGGGDG